MQIGSWQCQVQLLSLDSVGSERFLHTIKIFILAVASEILSSFISMRN